MFCEGRVSTVPVSPDGNHYGRRLDLTESSERLCAVYSDYRDFFYSYIFTVSDLQKVQNNKVSVWH